MKYNNIEYGYLKGRINRFIAEVNIRGSIEFAHIRNTGRLKELLKPGVEIILEENDNPLRKTKYSLISVRIDGRLVNVNSLTP